MQPSMGDVDVYSVNPVVAKLVIPPVANPEPIMEWGVMPVVPWITFCSQPV
jgi:hypothetical protein